MMHFDGIVQVLADEHLRRQEARCRPRSAPAPWRARRRALTPTPHAPPRAGLRLHLLHCSNYRFFFFAKITFQLSL